MTDTREPVPPAAGDEPNGGVVSSAEAMQAFVHDVNACEDTRCLICIGWIRGHTTGLAKGRNETPPPFDPASIRQAAGEAAARRCFETHPTIAGKARQAALQEARAAALIAVPCCCTEAYTARGLEAPDCRHHDLVRERDGLAE